MAAGANTSSGSGVIGYADGAGSIEVDLAALVHETLAVSGSPFCEAPTLELDLELLPPVLCNAHQIREVLLELVQNAAGAMRHACTAGRIIVSTNLDEDAVLLCAADQGAGVPDDQRERMFDATADEPVRGLAKARRIVRAHGGDLWCVSVQGQGSKFYVRLPLERPVCDDG